jgi:hypothetical protein
MFINFLVKYKKKNLMSKLLNLVLLLMVIFSANFLEEDLIIGTFSTVVLVLIFMLLRDLISENLREYRKNIKKIFRVQRDFLKRNYFIHNKLSRLNFLYIKKIIFKYYFVKSLKLFLNLNLKVKNFLSNKTYFKLYYVNLIMTFISKLSFKLFNLIKH